MEAVLILGLLAIVSNGFLILYNRRGGRFTKNVKLSDLLQPPKDYAGGYLIRKDLLALIHQSSAELGISVKELVQMPIKQIRRLSIQNKRNTKAKILRKESNLNEFGN